MSLEDVRVHLIDSVDTAGEFMRWLSTKDRVAFDTETTGLNKQTDHVRLVQFGDTQQGWVIPFDRWGGVVEEVFDKFTGLYDAWNLTFDAAMLANDGITVPESRCHDGRLMRHVIQSTGSTALKKVATELVDKRAAVMQQQLDEAIGKKGGWTWATVPLDYEPYWSYAGLDTVLTARCIEILEPQMRADAPAAYELELAVAWVTSRMERRGVLVDREYVQRYAEQLTRYVADVESWCKKEFSVYPGSSKEVINALQRDGVEFKVYTASGAICLDKAVLSSIDHPLAGAVLGRRQAEKLVSTYLENYLTMSARDGLIHPSINTVGGVDRNSYEPGGSKGVRTGRMSMSDPNLQNVPTRTKEGKMIRRSFIARPGNRWIKCDADQIEMRCMAHLSGDQGMIEAFTSGGDFFVNMASRLFNDPDFQKSDPRRQMVKNGGYAKIYGAGMKKFSETAGVPLDEGRAFMNTFDALFPGVPRWINEVEQNARYRRATEGDAYVRSPYTNRKLTADEGREYALVNYCIQGFASELLKKTIVEADAAGLGEYMILPVHDEIDLDVPEVELDDVTATLADVVNDYDSWSVPLTWSMETGPNWGECS